MVSYIACLEGPHR